MKKKKLNIILVKNLLPLFLLAILLFTGIYYFANKEEFSLNKKVSLPIRIEDNTKNVILFFGYVGCPTVCPTALSSISLAYEKIGKEKGQTQVLFISLTDTTNSSADIYAKLFNKNFSGFVIEKNKQKLIDEYNVFWSEARKETNKEAAHSPYIYFLEHHKHNDLILKYIYTKYPPKVEDIIYYLKKMSNFSIN